MNTILKIDLSVFISIVSKALLVSLLLFIACTKNKEPKPVTLSKSFELKLADIVSMDPTEVVLINFWASWCDPCVEEIPSMLRLKDKLVKTKTKAKLVFINFYEQEKEVADFTKSLSLVESDNVKIKFIPKVLGESLLTDLKTTALPATIIVKNNKLLKKVIGYEDWDKPQVFDYLKSIGGE